MGSFFSGLRKKKIIKIVPTGYAFSGFMKKVYAIKYFLLGTLIICGFSKQNYSLQFFQ